MTPELVGAAALGGLLGAPARFLVDRAVSRHAPSGLPWGTLLVNITGSVLLGFLTGLVLHAHLGQPGAVLLGTGFCGAYTTFSTFAYETLDLVAEDRLRAAAFNVVLSIGVGLLGAAAGVALGLAA